MSRPTPTSNALTLWRSCEHTLLLYGALLQSHANVHLIRKRMPHTHDLLLCFMALACHQDHILIRCLGECLGNRQSTVKLDMGLLGIRKPATMAAKMASGFSERGLSLVNTT